MMLLMSYLCLEQASKVDGVFVPPFGLNDRVAKTEMADEENLDIHCKENAADHEEGE